MERREEALEEVVASGNGEKRKAFNGNWITTTAFESADSISISAQ